MERDEEWQGRRAGGSDGWVFCGSPAGDLSEERIREWPLFVEAQLRDILPLKWQAPAVTGRGGARPPGLGLAEPGQAGALRKHTCDLLVCWDINR